MNLIQIEGHQDLLRDQTTNAILNTNKNEYNCYLQASQLRQKEKNKVENLERDLDTIKQEISQVKTLIQELLNAPR